MPLLALALAALAATICFDARPGINWPLWVIPAAAGLYHFAGPARRSVTLPLALAVLLSLGAAITANAPAIVLIALSGATLLAVAMRVAAGAPASGVGAGFIAASPFIGGIGTVGESWRRATEAAHDGTAHDSLPVLRGVFLATPVLLVLWYLFAQADPHMSAWGEAIVQVIKDLAFIPRLLFGIATGVLVFGAYGLVMRAEPRRAPTPFAPPMLLAATERKIILGAVVLLLSLFCALQFPYLFGNPAGATGSGVTYAEWAHRGFGELTAAATLITVLIVLLDTHAARGRESDERTTRAFSLALVALTALVVLSAFRRITLYESAYGYTVARLWAQAFMAGVAIALLLLAMEVRGSLDARRLARRTGTAAAAMLALLIFWNHEAFIVRRNVDRFAGSGKVDISYLATSLSLDAIPELFAMRPRLTIEQAARLTTCLSWRRERDWEFRPGAWYEFNSRRAAGIEAMKALAGVPQAEAKDCMGNRD